ncbi:unnamed protein product [Orchesella dallaii]|uniref:Non-specific serine/threonine protein kinase n=1 Tax=Orchesella dallaii TaxID=48710 RepID=A0ABP1PZA4_9HEXA
MRKVCTFPTCSMSKIKPALFCEFFKVYLIDFGLALRYCDSVTGAHIYCHSVKNLIGTARFASLNAHLGFEQCRRDDLESIGYMLVYFMNGSLPWMLERKKEETKNYLDRIKESKRGTTIDVLCKDLPSAFKTYFSYCRALGYKQEPDYNYLREIFKNLFKSRGFKNDHVYNWMAFPENDEDNNCQSQIKVRYVKKKSGCVVN